MSNSLNPDQDRCFVGPDLGPNCLQRLSADDKVTAIKERVSGSCTTKLPEYSKVVVTGSMDAPYLKNISRLLYHSISVHQNSALSNTLLAAACWVIFSCFCGRPLTFFCRSSSY